MRFFAKFEDRDIFNNCRPNRKINQCHVTMQEPADLEDNESKEKNIARKRKHSPEEEYGFSCPTPRRSTVLNSSHKTANFFFKPEHRSIIEGCLGDMIKSFCQEVFGIETDKVVFGYGDVKKYLGYPVYCDIDTKLAVLIVSGVEPAQVQKYRENLEQCIITIF